MIQFLAEIFQIYKETFPTLLFSGAIALLPGYFLVHYFNESSVPAGLLMLIPGLIGMRGNIFGALCSKITSLNNSMHNSSQNEFKIGDDEENESLKEKISIENQIKARYRSSITEVLFLSTILPIFSHIYFLHFGGAQSLSEIKPNHHYSSYDYDNAINPINNVNNHPYIDYNSHIKEHILPLLLFICTTSGLISGILLLKCTQFVIKKAQTKGFDADNIAPPLITTLGDVITLPIISLCTYIATLFDLHILWFFNAVIFSFVIYLIISLYRFHPKMFTITIKERIPILLACLSFSSISGLLLEQFITEEENTALFQLVMLIPLVNGQGGNAGSIYSSRISSSLAKFYRDHPNSDQIVDFLHLSSSSPNIHEEFINKKNSNATLPLITHNNNNNINNNINSDNSNNNNINNNINEKRTSEDFSNQSDEVSIYLSSSLNIHSQSNPSSLSIFSLLFDSDKSSIINSKRLIEVIAITLSLFSIFSILIFYVTYFLDFNNPLSPVDNPIQLYDLFIFFTLLSVVLGTSSLFFAILATVFSLHFRYDPDNTSIAVVCAIMDIIGTFSMCYLSSFFF